MFSGALNHNFHEERMKKIMKALRILLAVAVAVMMMSSAALAELNIGANVEINTDFKSQTTEKGATDGSDLEETVFEQGGRVKVTFTEKNRNG
jgi:uncharacterized protein YxeA